MDFDPASLEIWADADLLVINKPSGLLAIPDGYDPDKPHLRSVLMPNYGPLWIVHRLDRDTSGVIVLARTAEAHRNLNVQFSNHQVTKTYRLLIDGDPNWKEITIDLPLRTNVGRRKRTAVDPQRGKPAVTYFRVLERMGGISILEALPKTGRTHQIRAHLYDQGFSILSDPLYGEGEQSSFIPRLALHAQAIEFVHSSTGEIVSFKAPYPDDIENALAQLRKIKM